MRTNDVPSRAVIGLSLGLALALGAPLPAARADSFSGSKQKKKVMVGAFAGPKSAEAREAVIASLKDDGGYDVAETSAVKPGADDNSFANASSGASAVLVGTLKRGVLTLSVRNGADGALVQEVRIRGESASKLNKAIADTLTAKVAEAVAQAKPVSTDVSTKRDASTGDADEEKLDKTPADEPPKAAPASDASPFPDGHSPLEIAAGLRAVHRAFSYHDTAAQLFPASGAAVPATYKLPLGPAVFVDGTIYPGAFAWRGLAGGFGITAGYELNFGTKSAYNAISPTTMKQVENKLTTNAYQYFVGAKARIPIGADELGGVVAYGQQTFNLLGYQAQPTVPNVSYRFIKIGLDGRFRFEAASLGVHAATRIVNSTGGLERDWFPGHVKTQSVDAGVSVGYALAPPLEVLVGLDLTRYAFNFNPVTATNSRVIAGGATDQFISAFLGVRYSLTSYR